eukprot:gene2064-1250_t
MPTSIQWFFCSPDGTGFSVPANSCKPVRDRIKVCLGREKENFFSIIYFYFRCVNQRFSSTLFCSPIKGTLSFGGRSGFNFILPPPPAPPVTFVSVQAQLLHKLGLIITANPQYYYYYYYYYYLFLVLFFEGFQRTQQRHWCHFSLPLRPAGTPLSLSAGASAISADEESLAGAPLAGGSRRADAAPRPARTVWIAVPDVKSVPLRRVGTASSRARGVDRTGSILYDDGKQEFNPNVTHDPSDKLTPPPVAQTSRPPEDPHYPSGGYPGAGVTMQPIAPPVDSDTTQTVSSQYRNLWYLWFIGAVVVIGLAVGVVLWCSRRDSRMEEEELERAVGENRGKGASITSDDEDGGAEGISAERPIVRALVSPNDMIRCQCLPPPSCADPQTESSPLSALLLQQHQQHLANAVAASGSYPGSPAAPSGMPSCSSNVYYASIPGCSHTPEIAAAEEGGNNPAHGVPHMPAGSPPVGHRRSRPSTGLYSSAGPMGVDSPLSPASGPDPPAAHPSLLPLAPITTGFCFSPKMMSATPLVHQQETAIGTGSNTPLTATNTVCTPLLFEYLQSCELLVKRNPYGEEGELTDIQSTLHSEGSPLRHSDTIHQHSHIATPDRGEKQRAVETDVILDEAGEDVPADHAAAGEV